MRKEFTLNDGRKLVYNESAWTGKRTITIDGVAINSINKKLFNDGVNNYKIEGNQFSGISIVTNNETLVVLDKLNAFEIFLACIPFIMCFIGGALGGLLGALAAIVNLSAIRACKNIFTSIVVSITSTLVAFGIWFVIASFLLNLI